MKSISGLKLHQKVPRNKTLLAPSEVEATSDSSNHEQSSNINNVTSEKEYEKTMNEAYEKWFSREKTFPDFHQTKNLLTR